jgi:beta-aspartyl-peptidase (threonine type)
MMFRPSHVPLVLITLALALPLARPTGAAPGAAPNDSLLRVLVAPVPSPFAPTMCVIPEDQDPAAVRRLLDAQVAAWNRGDLEGFMKGYWKSDSLTFYSGGDISHGWQVTLDRYRKRYQSQGHEMGTLVFDLHDVTLPARGQALVLGGWSLKLKDGEPRGLFTLWLRWFPDGGWRVVHDHSSAAA